MKAFMTDPVVRRIAVMLIVVMGVVSLIPRVEASFVPSDQSLASSSRQDDMAAIQSALEHKLVRERLRDLSYTEDEIRARLDQLSEAELHGLATQLDALVPAGNGFEVAVIILLIVILIVLVLIVTGKRVHVS